MHVTRLMMKVTFWSGLVAILISLMCVYFTPDYERDVKDKAYDSEHQRDILMRSYEAVITATWTGNRVLPNINNKAYITTLINYICDDTENTLLIGGPKDSGKTMGLVFVSRAAKKIGHPVFELNLKGSVDQRSVTRVMEDFSHQFTEFFDNIEDGSKLKCIYDTLQNCPALKASWHDSFNSVIDNIIMCIHYLLTATALGAIPIYIYQSVRYHYIWKLIYLWSICAIIFSGLTCLLPPKLLFYRLSYLVHGYKEQVKNGDWDVVFCTLNSVERCDILKPILIINDEKKIQVNHLGSLFGALETKKDYGRGNKPKFPIILEMSDNLWMRGIYSNSSNSAFCFYYLEEMTYIEGKDEMVQKYHLFDDKTFNYLYQIFCGHTRFYAYYWKRRQGLSTHEDVMYNLMTENQITLSACLMGIDTEHEQTETSKLFQRLKNNNFSTTELYLSHVMKTFISCNLLYYNAKDQHLIVQNPLLEVMIDRYCNYIANKTDN